MERINLHAFYEMGHRIHVITTLSGERSWGSLFGDVLEARKVVEALKGGEPVRLRNPQPIDELLGHL